MNHCRMHEVARITEAELLIAKVKLAGLMILGLVCAVVLMVSPP